MSIRKKTLAKRIVVALALSTCLMPQSSFACLSASLFGYTGIFGDEDLQTANNLDIHFNLANLNYEESNWQDVDTEGVMTSYAAEGIRAAVFVEGFLFETVAVPGSPCNYDGSIGEPHGRRLRSDWLERLKSWQGDNGSFFTHDSTAFLIVSAEVNNQCYDMEELVVVGKKLKKFFPDLHLAIGWGRTHVDIDPMAPHAQPAPAHLPGIFDILGMWSYGIYDPMQPLHPKNANADFYDPAFPENPDTDYGYVLANKAEHQQVVLIFDAHFQTYDHGVHNVLGWSLDDLGDLAVNYELFSRQRPEISGLLGFHWTSTARFLGAEEIASKSEVFRQAHRDIGCIVVGVCG